MRVAPLAGAWIEIFRQSTTLMTFWSLPSRERGLKFERKKRQKLDCNVAPLAGAWIEILVDTQI